jgi:hypothetical protein
VLPACLAPSHGDFPIGFEPVRLQFKGMALRADRILFG